MQYEMNIICTVSQDKVWLKLILTVCSYVCPCILRWYIAYPDFAGLLIALLALAQYCLKDMVVATDYLDIFDKDNNYFQWKIASRDKI